MDGSVSTLAPLFAAAFATSNNWDAFRVGLAASIGAGISMGFAEALSDDGSLTGRGRPLIRGVVCGLMTAAGGLGHTLPYLIPDSVANAFKIATLIALVVVLAELAVISWVRHRFMESPWLSAAIQVIIGGLIVLATGILDRVVIDCPGFVVVRRNQRAANLHAKIKKEPRGGALGSGGGSEEGLGEELPQMGEGQREGNTSFRYFQRIQSW